MTTPSSSTASSSRFASWTPCDANCSPATAMRDVRHVHNAWAEMPSWFHSHEMLDALVQLCVAGNLVWCAARPAAVLQPVL